MDQAYLDLKAWLEQTRDEPLEGMGAFFDLRIDEYEAHMSPWQAHYQWMAELLPDGIGTLLDIGCGSGLELDTVFQRFPSLQVTGIDLSEKMLDRLVQKHGGRALTVIQEDYFLHPFESAYFDAAVSFQTLHHFSAEKKTRLFSKLYGSLKPGGVYLECDYVAKTQEIETLCASECERRRLRDGITSDRFIHFDTPLTLEHEIQSMKAAGFGQVEVVGYLPGDDHTPMIRALK